MRTGLITSKDRAALYKEVLPRGTIIECDPKRRLKDTLREMSRKAVNVAVVDDAGLAHPEADELEMLDWAALPQKHPLRIVFAASADRSPKDPLFAALAEAQVYDIVHPDQPDELFQAVRQRVENPASADDVQQYLSRSPRRRGGRTGQKTPGRENHLKRIASSHPLPTPPKPIERESEENQPCTEPSWSHIMPETPKQTTTHTKRRKVVSTASLFGHPGATTLAMSLALWLAKGKRKKIVCALSDNAFFNHLKAGFNVEAAAESFEYKGVTFCTFAEAEALADDASWAIYDCGRLFTTHADTPASNAHRRFYTSNMKLMCLEGQPWDTPKVKDALKDMAPSEIASWTWCIRSASSDFIAQLKAYLTEMHANTESWFKTPDNPEFFGRTGHDGFDKVNYDGLLGKSRHDQEGGCL